eukprot:TRINITY_DN12875_c0_g1_i1.p1 TRINITY_DN12875_c0_g1~~TRINITY_DN12875_c0_g1_i1.p1  ORF type:complete len:549 (+),score=149.10 TRINITY_DN12875_c0_g1_i1:61-1647(+)
MARPMDELFDDYQMGRVRFVQTVADLASRPQHIPGLQQRNILLLLRPLLADPVESIQQSAALAVGRLASYSDELALECVQTGIHRQLSHTLSEHNKYYKKSACYVLRAIAQHSPQLAQECVEAGAVQGLVACLEELDEGVKEGAAWALSYIARHTIDLAQTVIDHDAVPYLIRCVEEPIPSLQRTAVQCLIDISRHSSEQAAVVVDRGALRPVASQMLSSDARLRRSAVQCLATFCKHDDERGLELAECVVMEDVLAAKPSAPRVPPLLADEDEAVARNAAVCIREIVKFSAAMCRIFVGGGHLQQLVSFVSEAAGQTVLAGVMALGYIGAFEPELAGQVITKGGVPPLARVLRAERGACQASAAWALGQIGGHGPEHSKAVTDCDTLTSLVDILQVQQSTDDMAHELHDKCKKALKKIVSACYDPHALYPLLHPRAPESILKYVCAQLAKPGLLDQSPQNQREFVANRGLETLLRIEARPNTELHESIKKICAMFSSEMVAYFDPHTPTTLMDQIDSQVLRGPTRLS